LISPKLVFLDLGGRGIVISTKRKEKRGFKEKKSLFNTEDKRIRE